MRHVYLAAMKSKDPRTRIGAVLVEPKSRSIVSEGFNGFPRGVQDYYERYHDKPEKLVFVVHAEHNAILNAARRGQATSNLFLYTQGIPCHECAKAIIQAGVQRVITHKQWPAMDAATWRDSVAYALVMFDEAGVQHVEFDGLLNLNGFAQGKPVPV